MARINMQLLAGALTKYLMGLVMFGLLLFLPAGTMSYWNAWVLIAALFGPMLILGIVLLVKSPDLLAKRLASKEKESQQKTVVALSALMFLASFILALSMPLILGSMMSFVVMLVYIPIISARIKNEEKVLSEGLPGYKEYKQKVRNKVIPFIW